MNIRFTVKEELPEPARTAINIVQTALRVPRKTAQSLIHDGAVVCNGRMITQNHVRCAVGDLLDIEYDPDFLQAPESKANVAAKFEVLHCDDDIVVVNKPAGQLTVPSPRRERNTLDAELKRWLTGHDGHANSICVHRLDRGVSGLLVFARSSQAAEQLRQQFVSRSMQRQYIAIVQGRMREAEGTFESYLASDNQLRQRSSRDAAAGQLAITHYRVTEPLATTSMVSVKLETGRRNQIRVHFAEARHPIVGDPRYRAKHAAHPLWPLKRIALHAESLGLLHPADGRELQFSTSWPQEFREFRKQDLRRSSR